MAALSASSLVLATLNLYAVVLLVGTVPCLVTAVALAARAARGLSGWDRDLWLAAWLVAVVLLVAPYLLGFAGAYDTLPWLSNTPIGAPFLLGAAALGYTLAATGAAATRWSPWLLSPTVLAFGVGLWAWGRSTWGGIPYRATVGPAASAVLHPAATVFNVVCLALAARAVVRARRRPEAPAAAGEALRDRWLARFLAAVGATFAVSLGFDLAYALGAPFSYERQWWAHGAYIALGYYVAWAGYGAHRALGAAPLAKLQPSGPPPMSEHEVSRWMSRLDAWMRDRRPHLRSDLSLASLAAEVGLTPAELSHVVNAGFGTNVSEFVNGYRVREVQARLLEAGSDRLTLLAVAEACGFASKATFNRAFRRETGTTPSAWKAEHRARDGRAGERAAEPTGLGSRSEATQKAF